MQFHFESRSMAPRRACTSVIVAATLLLSAASASAQWMWKDDAGRVIASDQPPPVGVPQSRIVKEPRARPAAPPAVAADKDGAAKEVQKGDAPKSLAERELESRQRQKEAADAAKKSEDESNKAKALQENCGTVRGNLAALQAGGRAARFNEKGERFYLDDAQRQTEITKSQGQIAQYCK